MSFFQQILQFLRSLVDWWFIVEPWEQAIRVRLGKRVRLFGAGIHISIPFIDVVYKQNTRHRVMTLGTQTMTTRDGSVLTLNGSLGYRIDDVLKLQHALHDAEASVLQKVLGVISKYVAANDAAKCTPAELMSAVSAALDLSKYGLGDVDFFLSSYVSNVPTVRLIQDHIGGYVGGSTLSTSGWPSPPAIPR